LRDAAALASTVEARPRVSAAAARTRPGTRGGRQRRLPLRSVERGCRVAWEGRSACVLCPMLWGSSSAAPLRRSASCAIHPPFPFFRITR